ncbi:hypothetical protein [uncultured Endozoicomonas sp.]|uniref:hypothetical protein n=1 Tax=uncultured Endozoicomonas sp. TaxID=432652 RepID=UPI0026307FF5|nr:hypothetical protein [uncultured Endozoicomonas sp.]
MDISLAVSRTKSGEGELKRNREKSVECTRHLPIGINSVPSATKKRQVRSINNNAFLNDRFVGLLLEMANSQFNDTVLYELSDLGLNVQELLDELSFDDQSYYGLQKNCINDADKNTHKKKLSEYIQDNLPDYTNLIPEDDALSQKQAEDLLSKISDNVATYLSFIPDRLKTEGFLTQVLDHIRILRKKNNGKLYDWNLPDLGSFPEQIVTKEIAEIYLESSWRNIYKIPKKYVSEPMWKEVCLKGFSNLNSVPDEYKSESLYSQVCKKAVHAIKYVPKRYITPELLKGMTYIPEAYLVFVPEELITYELMEKTGIYIDCDEIEEDLCGVDLCDRLILHNESFLKILPDTAKQRHLQKMMDYIRTTHSYIRFYEVEFDDPQRVFKELIGINYRYISEAEKYKDREKIDLEQLYFLRLGQTFNERRFDESIIWKLGSEKIYQYCVNELHNKKSKKHCIHLVNLLAKYDQGKALLRPLLDELATRGYPELIKLMLTPKLPIEEKIALIDRLRNGDLAPDPDIDFNGLYAPCDLKDGYNKNHFLPLLQKSLYQDCNTHPVSHSFGDKIEQFITKNTPSSFGMIRAEYQRRMEELTNKSTCGGRAFKGEHDGKTYYYKIQREGEPLATLAREGLMHQVCERREFKLNLESDIPEFVGFFQVPVSSLPFTADKFTDTLKINNQDGEPTVNVYCYRGHPDYCHYVYKPIDPNNMQDSKERCIKGLLKAGRDIGVLSSFGLMPTSVVPAFHDTESGRRWAALSSLLGSNSRWRDGVAGTFGAWNTDATARPDFGITGFRDIGDTEQFGNITSFFQYKDAKGKFHSKHVNQKIAWSEVFCDSNIAAILLFARFCQQCPDYHYTNPESLKDMEEFIQNYLHQAVLGLYSGSDYSDHNLLKPQYLLGLDDVQYQKWLQRAAIEVVYWTALQPDEEGFDQLNSASQFDLEDCYSTHCNDQRGRFSMELYPADCLKMYGYGRPPIYPESFLNCNKKLNLGVNNGTFPFVALMQGYTLACARLLSTEFDNELKNFNRVPHNLV